MWAVMTTFKGAPNENLLNVDIWNIACSYSCYSDSWVSLGWKIGTYALAFLIKVIGAEKLSVSMFIMKYGVDINSQRATCPGAGHRLLLFSNYTSTQQVEYKGRVGVCAFYDLLLRKPCGESGRQRDDGTRRQVLSGFYVETMPEPSHDGVKSLFLLSPLSFRKEDGGLGLYSWEIRRHIEREGLRLNIINLDGGN